MLVVEFPKLALLHEFSKGTKLLQIIMFVICAG